MGFGSWFEDNVTAPVKDAAKDAAPYVLPVVAGAALGTLGVLGQVAGTGLIGATTGKKLAEDVDLIQSEEDKLQQAKLKENDAREKLYQETISEDNIDKLSQSEIVRLYASGASSAQIASHLTAAREGKGIFAIRKINENQARIQMNSPGRRQTLSLGRGTILG